MKSIYLVRHVQSEPLAGVHTAEWPLSGLGRTQVVYLAAELARLGIEEVYSSPYRRCVETVADFAASMGVLCRLDDELRERLFAPSVIDDFPEVLARAWADFDFALPGGESSHGAQQRIVSALRRIAAATRSTNIAVISHGNVLSLLLNAIDSGFGIERATAMRTPEVFRLTWSGLALCWDSEFELPGLDEFASPFLQTPFPQSGTRALGG